MKKIVPKIILLIIGLIALSIWYYIFQPFSASTNQDQVVTFKKPVTVNSKSINESVDDSSNTNIAVMEPFYSAPLDRASERATKKPFGIYITPADSPVQPERFQGYHTGTDFEVFEDELNNDVSIQAICSGELVLKQTTSGYGGVVVQSCDLDDEPITVVYGHLKLSSIDWSVGDSIEVGDRIGILGAGDSSETDGERKHLHLGIHKGSEVNIRGYVSMEFQLNAWLDPCQYFCSSE